MMNINPELMFAFLISLLIVLAVVILVFALALRKANKAGQNSLGGSEAEMEKFKDDIKRHIDYAMASNKDFQTLFASQESERFKMFSDATNNSMDTLRKTISEITNGLDDRMSSFQKQTYEQMESIRSTTERQMTDMQTSNEKKLEEMRATVDEKLQKTLDERINQSFSMVNERLEQVYKSLGEMQKIGSDVGDLKKVLSNVKTRGILGEVQLGAILSEMLSPEQYESNIVTKKGSRDPVEFAVKLPGAGEEPVFLPIDSKFPLDVYQHLLDAYDSGNPEAVQTAAKELKSRIKLFAKMIRDKYIDVPYTTDFAIMFLPTEGLYAEVVRYGLVEELQKDKINIAGPTTMAALLNSLQMGFRTLAIQKSSAEVWKVLGEVKTEFGKFSDVLQKTQKYMRQASDELEVLATTRTNMMNRKLKNVSEYTTLDSDVSSKSGDAALLSMINAE